MPILQWPVGFGRPATFSSSQSVGNEHLACRFLKRQIAATVISQPLRYWVDLLDPQEHAAGLVNWAFPGFSDGNSISKSGGEPNSFGGNTAAYQRLNGMTFVTGSTAYNLTSISFAMRYNQSGSISPTIRVYAFENASTAATKPVSLATPAFQEDFAGDVFSRTQEFHTFSPTATWSLKPNTS